MMKLLRNSATVSYPQALGNHEFDNGVEGLIKPFLQKVSCTVLSANIIPDQTLTANLSGYYRPYASFTVGSEKVAVVGYTSAETPFLSMPGMKTQLPFPGPEGEFNPPQLLLHECFFPSSFPKAALTRAPLLSRERTPDHVT